MFTTACHFFFSFSMPSLSTSSHPTHLTYFLIMSFHPRLCLLSWPFPSGLSTKILHAFPCPSIRVIFPTRLSCLSLINRIVFGKDRKSRGTRWRSRLRHCVTNRKVAGLITDGVIGIFHGHNPSDRTMALGLTQPVTEMSNRNISWWVKAADA